MPWGRRKLWQEEEEQEEEDSLSLFSLNFDRQAPKGHPLEKPRRGDNNNRPEGPNK
jgi:hypothetical protein